MNKSDLIDTLARELQLPAQEAAAIISTILTTMTKSLCRGESIEIRGFGSFKVRHYGSYEGREPKTGKRILVKEKKLPLFKVGKELREQVDAHK